MVYPETYPGVCPRKNGEMAKWGEMGGNCRKMGENGEMEPLTAMAGVCGCHKSLATFGSAFGFGK